MDQFASYLLLLHVLLPLFGALCGSLIVSPKVKTAFAWSMAVTVGLMSFTLLVVAKQTPQESVMVLWRLPFARSPTGLFQTVSWSIHQSQFAIVLLLPWVYVTSLLLSGRNNQQLTTLGLVGALMLVVVSSDAGSLLTGLLISVLLISLLSVPDQQNSKPDGSWFIKTNATGVLLMMGGLSALVGSAAIVRAAPYGLPGMTSTNLDELATMIAHATEQHPAADITWKQIQMLPYSFVMVSCFLFAGIFPCHFWIPRMIAESSKIGCVWLVIWSRVGVLLFSNLLHVGSSGGPQAIMVWLIPILLFGVIYSAALFLLQKSFNGWFAWAVIWSNQVFILAHVLLPGQEIIDILQVSQTAGLMLLLLADFSSSPESQMPSESRQASEPQITRHIVVLVLGCASIALIPGVAGLSFLWNSVGILRQGTTLLGLSAHLVLVLATGFFLVGLLKFFFNQLKLNPMTEHNKSQTDATIIWSLIALSYPFFTSWLK